MAKKLSAKDIGRLAEHVEAIMRRFPVYATATDSRGKSVPLRELDWEIELAEQVDRDENLPITYASLEKNYSGLLEFLIGYFEAA